jgi:phosphatidylserine/phosphatidylglycerophosphate/cardiolipin synthase-like enzyme
MRFRALLAPALLALALAPACGATDADIEDGASDTIPEGKADGAPTDAEIAGVLQLVNDPSVDQNEFDHDVGLSTALSKRLVKYRDGRDLVNGTSDDNSIDTLRELDDIYGVGPNVMKALIRYARAKGLIVDGDTRIDVIFSPQPAGSTHATRVAQMIRDAKHSVDIAMYSFSDADISAALEDAVRRGVKVRFLYEGAGDDGRAADKANTKSGRLERAGVDVRGVNKILHHKFAIIDGPRDVADRAATARMVTGSANWSYGGGQVYDENTLFIAGSAELAIAYQREFDLLWAHSKDFNAGANLPWVLSTATLRDASDDPGLEAFFTTANFTVAEGSTTFRVDTAKTVVSSGLIEAINSADRSIWVAQGHLRLRGVSEALIARHQADPDLDIRVYLDQQEFISASGHSAQVADREECLEAAGDDAADQRDCLEQSFLYSKMLYDAGVPLRFKSFAYRWDHSYAEQMHHKYIIIDGDELWTGSYNWSMNSEQGTFENVVKLTGGANKALIDKFETNFEKMWETGRAEDGLGDLRDQISSAQSGQTIPLVFRPLALTWKEFNDLRNLIRQRCPAADSQEFRSNPAAHKSCTIQ